MISLESQVLERHLPFFADKSLLFAGGVQDDFPELIQPYCRSVQVWSWYFDYAKDKSAVLFSPVFQGETDLVVYYWTKNKQETEFQLLQLLAQAKPQQEVLIIGENRCGVRSVEKMLAPFGEIAKIDSARRCGLYHFILVKPPVFDPDGFVKTYQDSKLGDLTVCTMPGIFSVDALDAGTELLLSTLNHRIHGKVLDMGCGAGVIGVWLKRHNPDIRLTMSDIHAMAIESAQRTLAANKLQGDVVVSDVFSHIEDKFDLIISNPPFHSGIDTAYHVVQALISQAKRHLTDGGELRIVANAFLPYPDLLDHYFGSHRVVAKTNKFKVYSVRN